MAKAQIPQFMLWRGGRPRWHPGPRLRVLGWKGRDLKDELGHWLPFEQACAAAAALNQDVAAAGSSKAPKTIAQRGRAIDDLLEAYFKSNDFLSKRPNTQADYRKKAAAIRFKPRTREEVAKKKPQEWELFAKAPVAVIDKPAVKAMFEYMRKARSLAMARGAIMVLSAAWTWGTMSTDWRLKANPCHDLDLPLPPPRVRIATDAEIRALVAAADALAMPSIGDAVFLGLLSGQRQGDILALVEPRDRNRSLVDVMAAGEAFVVEQAKTRAKVSIFAVPQLIARMRLADDRRRARKVIPEAIVVCEATGQAWGASNFRHRYADVRALAVAGSNEHGLPPCPSVATLNFQDLRDTAITWLARSGCTIPEIASISGHTPGSIVTILKHYLQLDEHLAKGAMSNLARWLEAQGVEL